MTFDPINKPSHYAEGRKYETIDVIEDWSLGYRLGNCVKYISRNGRKDPSKTVEDLKKAKWYLEREIESLEGSQGPYSVTYEDVLQDHAACAVEGFEPLYEYGNNDVIDDWTYSADELKLDFSSTGNVFLATEKDEHDFWHNEDVPFDPFGTSDSDILWDPTSGPIELSDAEIYSIISKKDLKSFEDDEIVSTVHRRGLVIGVKKDGSTCLLSENG